MTASAPRSGASPRPAPSGPPVGVAVGPLGAVQAADREIARQAALRARAVAEFAASRPASVDRAQGEPGAMSAERWAARPELLRRVSEWAAGELVVALSISSEAAEKLLVRSLTLVHRLPRTLEALESGALHEGHLWPMLEKVGPIDDPTVRAEVEERLLSWAAGRVTTPAQLGARARREVLTRDARGAARRLSRAITERGVHLRPEGTEGMAAVTAVLTMPEALALYRALEALTENLTDPPGADPRTRGQKMADCLLDLVLRPGEANGVSVQVLLTVVASMGTVLGGDEPGEVDGHVVPAEMVRHLLRACADRAGAPADEAAPAPAAGPSPAPCSAEDCYPVWDPADDEDLARWWTEVERRILADELDGEPEHPPEEALRRWAGEAGGWNARDEAEPDRHRTPGPDAGQDSRPGEALSGPADPDDPDPAPAPAPAPDPRSDRGPGGSAPRKDGAAGAAPAWWSAADAAVEDAGAALRAAGEALGHARRMVRTATAADAADEEQWRAGRAGRITAAEDAVAALAAASDAQRAELAWLLENTGGGGLAERPRIALVDALSGTLLALTDLAELRRAGTCGAAACRRRPESCRHELTGRPGLSPPGPTDGYRPGAALDRYVRARDRRCRFPGCRRRVPRGGELDHARPYPLGPTSAGNLVGFCTRNHRGKHQAPGWSHELAPDGTLTVRTPSGLTASTAPPPY